jgi:alanyl-tRNA synthetase
MTTRLYYTDCFLSEFDATVSACRGDAVVLDQTAFYPTSGGQVFDTGTVEANGLKLRVIEVAEDERGDVLHRLESAADVAPGARVHGAIDVPRRRDHMQQHSGQHVLSAAFVQLFSMATVSFHMGEESCTIDLDAKALTDAQLREAERAANDVVFEDRPVSIRFATPDQARALGVRKLPADVKDELRLIDIADFDLTACGGTHVRSTGQIGPILVRKTEKVRQGVRVEFVCGGRAVRTARRDFETLTQAAALYSAHIWDVPAQIGKTLEEAKAADKQRKRLLEELAELHAARLLRDADRQVFDPEGDPNRPARMIRQSFAERDLAFIKMVAQKLTAQAPAVALLACGGAQPALVFAQSTGLPFDMGKLLKDELAAAGGRGGGTRDMAQGGLPAGADVEELLRDAAAKIQQQATGS